MAENWLKGRTMILENKQFELALQHGLTSLHVLIYPKEHAQTNIC